MWNRNSEYCQELEGYETKLVRAIQFGFTLSLF